MSGVARISPHPGLLGLIELSQRDGADLRPTLLRAIVDLYVQERVHTRREEARFIELVCRLLDAVDEPTRAAVAVRLAPFAATPFAVASRLARDTSTVAEPVLRLSPALHEAELHAILDANGAEHARAVALRANLPASVAERVAGAGPAPVTSEIRIPAVAPPAEPDVRTLRRLLADPALTVTLARRYLIADEAERKAITAVLACSGSLADEAAIAGAESVGERLEQAALKHRPGQFAHLLGAKLGVPPRLALRIVSDAAGDALAVVCRALGIPAEVAGRIFLFLNPEIGQSVEKVFELARRYREIEPAAARRLVAAWRRIDPPSLPDRALVRTPQPRETHELPTQRTGSSIAHPRRAHGRRAGRSG